MNTIDILQTVGIVGSILLGIWQVRAHTAQLRLEHSHKLTEGFNELIMVGFNHPEIFDELSKPYKHKKVVRDRAWWLLAYMSNKFERAFHQYRDYGALSKKTWEEFAPLILIWLQTTYGTGFWEKMTDDFSHTVDKEYIAYINSLLNEK